jgi:putative DNA methylase
MGKKLIETAWPLAEISQATIWEKNHKTGHPSTLHLWWRRLPLVVARAVLFAALVDDPKSHPEKFSDYEAQKAERERLFQILKDLLAFDKNQNPAILDAAKEEIEKSGGFKIPPILDPFAGGGSIALETQRLGLRVLASDLNPVAVMINKASLEFPGKFRGLAPVNPQTQGEKLFETEQGGADNLAEDVAYYAAVWKKKIMAQTGRLYPGLKTLDKEGQEVEYPTLAWVWTRTVKCPNPACALMTPLAPSFVLAKKQNRLIYAAPTILNGQLAFTIQEGSNPPDGSINRKEAKCPICQSPIQLKYIKEEGINNRLGVTLMATVAKGPSGRVYKPATPDQEIAANAPRLDLPIDLPLSGQTQLANYGLKNYADLYTARQLIFFKALSETLPSIIEEIEKDALKAKMANDNLGLEEGGLGAKAYSQAISVYLAFLIDKLADYHSSLSVWENQKESINHAFGRSNFSMVWAFAEGNPLAVVSGGFDNLVNWLTKAIKALPVKGEAKVKMADVKTETFEEDCLIVLDPPFYDHNNYSNLADYFYFWLRPNLKNYFKTIFATIKTPKNDELSLDLARFDGKSEKAKEFYETGLKLGLANLFKSQNPDYPMVIFCPFRLGEEYQNPQKEMGWEYFLRALLEEGYSVTGTWPLKVEMSNRQKNSKIRPGFLVIVARKEPKITETISRRDFLNAFRVELEPALKLTRDAGVLDFDELSVAGLGVGLAVYSRYARILEADGSFMSPRTALTLVRGELASLEEFGLL